MHTSSSFCTHTHSLTIWVPQTDGAKSGHCCGYSIHWRAMDINFTKKYINSNTEGLLSACPCEWNESLLPAHLWILSVDDVEFDFIRCQELYQNILQNISTHWCELMGKIFILILNLCKLVLTCPKKSSSNSRLHLTSPFINPWTLFCPCFPFSPNCLSSTLCFHWEVCVTRPHFFTG